MIKMFRVFLKRHKGLAIVGAVVVFVPILLGATTTGYILVPSSASVPPVLQPTAFPGGDVERGRDYFMGNAHLQNGGPPCMGCHNVGSNGLLGGGALGPDLTDAAKRYGVEGLANTLETIPWPSMIPIFTDHPLTSQEQADLHAFLVASTGEPIGNREPWLIGLSLAGLIGIAVFFGLIYRRRIRGVRRALMKTQHPGDRKHKIQGGIHELD